jgi:putative heme-binding domain-containing protein
MLSLPKLGLICTALVLSLHSLATADDRVVTQTPAVAPAQAREKPVAEKPKERSTDKLFRGGPTPLWIWGADFNKNYFLRKEIPDGAVAARLKATCDNRLRISINGAAVVSSDEWKTPVEVDVTKYLKAKDNVLVAEVINDGGVAGFVMKLALTMPKDEVRYLVSDETWQAAEKKDSKTWVAARKVGKLGDAPWGDVFAASPLNGSFTPVYVFNVLPGFQVEHLFTVPRDQLGSWVSITCDPKGRLIVSDQEKKGLCRVTPPPIGSKEATKVEHLDVKITAAQGLLFAFDSLYVSVNGGPGSGLYRVRASKGDDHFDEVVKLASIRGGGEHGPHGLRLSPDGKSIFIVCGNHTMPPEKINASRLPTNWAEDLLLPRQWDANGHARGILAPGGWVARTDPDGKTWEMFSSGYRNTYDMAFNADGELFTYDADMEWDMGSPWYRPTRVCHAISGSEFGWRSGTGKWPTYYVDSLPPLLDIGPGSPVGVEFGYGAKFPAKYQKALYCLDWTFGTIYALHLEPSGSTYKAVKEEFVSRTPLPLTDAVVATDGALYFITGGRGTQSELFRVTYVGKESTAKVDYHDKVGAEARALRRRLEAYQSSTADQAKAVEFIYPHLGDEDRFIRYAARVALEHQKPALWQDRVLAEMDSERLITGAVALARQGDKALQSKLLAALDRLDFAALAEPQQLELLRTYGLAFIRMGEPDKETAARTAKHFDAFYPAKSDPLNRELVNLLVYLKSSAVIARTIALMKQESKPPSAADVAELLARNPGYGGVIAKMLANAPDLQKYHYAFALRNLREGWTQEQRRFYFEWIGEARQKSGGASYQGFLNNMEKDAFDNATDADRLYIEAAGLRKPFKPKALPKAQGPGREWKLDELVKFAEPKLKGRDFKNGEKMYAAARCVVCHRFNGDGGATGPDLTQVAGRFNLKDLSESIVEPSKVIADQYRASIVNTKSGKTYTGRIVSESKDALTIVTDPEDSTKVVEVKKSDVDEMTPSAKSLMPEGLLKELNDNEVLDLLAYLLSRGDPNHPMFRK